MFTSPRYRINGKSVNTLSENVETSTALIVTSQEIFQETGHWTFPEQNEAVNNWLVKKLKGE